MVRSEVVEELRAVYSDEVVSAQLDALKEHGTAVEDPELWLRTAVDHDFQFTPIATVTQCPCGSTRSILISRFVYWNLLAMRECEECGLVYVSPRLAPEAINQIFNEYYFDHSDPEYWGHRRVPVFKDVVRLLRHYSCRRVFDVGAAYGHFLKCAADDGLDASGCDISQKAVDWGRRNLGVDIRLGTVHDMSMPSAAFDCVVALDTLYYVPDPLADLLAMQNLIRPGGYVLLRLRNNKRVAAKARREGQKPAGKPVIPMPHVWAFTPATIKQLLSRCGFRTLLCEAAVPSRATLPLIDQIPVRINRALSGRPLRLPPLTRSINVVAVRPG